MRRLTTSWVLTILLLVGLGGPASPGPVAASGGTPLHAEDGATENSQAYTWDSEAPAPAEVEARSTLLHRDGHGVVREFDYRPDFGRASPATDTFYAYDTSANSSDPAADSGWVLRASSRPDVSLVTPRGGAGPVRVGQAGENAVRGAYDLGPKATVQINGRTRILDGLNNSAVSEVKNVGYQAYTQQLKDSLAYAQQKGLRFDLYLRGGPNPTTLSKPLQEAIANTPGFNLVFIP